MVKTVFVQNWEESERGWGVRPDGFTVHVSREQRDEYVKWFNKTFNNESSAPDEYTRISGEPVEVAVDAKLFRRIDRESRRKVEGRVVNAVHGEGSSFDTRKRVLKDTNIWGKK